MNWKKQQIVGGLMTAFLLASLSACSSTEESNTSNPNTSDNVISLETQAENTGETHSIYMNLYGMTLEKPEDITVDEYGIFHRDLSQDHGYSAKITLATLEPQEDFLENFMSQLNQDLGDYAESLGMEQADLVSGDITGETRDFTTELGHNFAVASACYSKAAENVPDPWLYLLFLEHEDSIVRFETTLANPEAAEEMEEFLLDMMNSMELGSEGILVKDSNPFRCFVQDEAGNPVYLTMDQANGLEAIDLDTVDADTETESESDTE